MNIIPTSWRIEVIVEADNGRNVIFKFKDKRYTRADMCDLINGSQAIKTYYHVAMINGKRTPKSNPGWSPNLD